MSKSWDVMVVGSCMTDLVCYAPRFPNSGETLWGTNFRMGCGGKGWNQCVAAQKLGAQTAFLARVADDCFGKAFCEQLKQLNIPSTFFKVTDGGSTGLAQITVVDSGENHIIIVSGANSKLSEKDVEEASDAIAQCKVLVCQMEIPEPSTLKALQIKASSRAGKSILNVAPAQTELHPLLFSLPDIFCLNETEAEILTGLKASKPIEAKPMIAKLVSKGCKEVVVTLGKEGAVYGRKGGPDFEHIPAPKVNAVDTTGAGDAFVGALAFYIASYPDMSMTDALKKATVVASISVQKLGTIESFPTVSELPP